MFAPVTLAVIAILLVASAAAYFFRSRVAIGGKVGPYRLEKFIGEGGMGVVYRASHAHLRRPAAVKFLPLGRSRELAVARFEREVQTTAQLTHPNTIAIYDYGRTARGLFYYAMELLHGLTLQQLVKRYGPISDVRTAYIVEQVCGSLSEAHDHGLVHRDIKPSNIFLCERGGLYDFVKVLDFGVAKEIDQTGGVFLTRPGALVGTPAYASPEMVRGATVDGRSDIYALGLVIYFLLVGDDLFAGGSTVEVLQQHIERDPNPPPGSLGRLEELVMSCLARNPADRPQSAEEVRDRIEALGLVGWGPGEAKRWWEAIAASTS